MIRFNSLLLVAGMLLSFAEALAGQTDSVSPNVVAPVFPQYLWLVGGALLLIAITAWLTASISTRKLHRRVAELESQLVDQSSELLAANDQLESQSRVDVLTGLLNRWAFFDLVNQELIRYRRNGQPFSLLIGDIDYFWQINDRCGRQAGDQVLTLIAGVLKSCTREQDLVARWGGEEFVLLLPESDQQGAMIVAEKIREAVALQKVPMDGEAQPVNMTLGVCQFKPGMTAAQCLEQAEAAMRRGKIQGRNQVVSA